jgi:hypothetical protein
VTDLAGCSSGYQLPRVRGHSARFVALHVELMQPGAGDMRQREARVLCNRAVEGVLGAVPGRQHAVHAIAVIRRGPIRSGRQRQIVSVPVHFFLVRHHEGYAEPSRDVTGGVHNIVAAVREAVEWMPIRR